MVRGSSDIIAWFENTGMPYWRIYPPKGIGSGNIIMQSRQEEGQSKGDALEDLKFKLRSINRGHFTMVAFQEPNKLPTKGYHLTDIEIPQQEAQQPQIAGTAGISLDEVENRIKAGISAYKAEVELSDMKKKVVDLEKENKSLKASTDAPLNKIIGAFAPYAGQIAGHIFPQATQVTGWPTPDPTLLDNNSPESEAAQELTTDQNEAVSKFLEVLVANDPDWVNTLNRLSAAIEKNPAMITMVKNFI